MSILLAFQLFIALFLIMFVLLQNRGTTGMGLSGGENFRSKRGIEKLLFYLTIIFAALFAFVSLLSLVYR
jgi:preprotein translocase subunit SecG